MPNRKPNIGLDKGYAGKRLRIRQPMRLIRIVLPVNPNQQYKDHLQKSWSK